MALASLTGCGPGPTAANAPTAPRSAQPTVAAAPSPSPPPLPPVTPVIPALQATYSGSFSAAQAQAVRGITGVIGVARITLGYVTAQTPGGLRQLSLAAVDPMEFRPLTPTPTASADFVWRGLDQGNIYLAHEEQPVLGVPLGDDVSLKGPAGRTQSLRLGGLAANGVPNIAGGLVSQAQADALGLPGPTTLLVAMANGVSITTLTGEIAKVLPPPTTIVPIVTLVNQALISGTAAERLLGSFAYKANPDGSISEDPAWVRANIVTRSVPILGSVTCNKLMFRQLIGALTTLQQEGLAGTINVAEYHQHAGNCYQPRFVDSDPSRGISYHAWGIAIDMNRVENPEGGANRQDPRLIAAFQQWGFRWGGSFYPPDPMHFELAGIMKQ